MNAGERPRASLLALALIVAGTLLFLDNLGIIPIQNIGAYWPLGLVLYGLGIVYCRRTANSLIWAGTFIVAGILLVLGNLGIVRANAGSLWPLLLIVGGALILVNRDSWEERARDRWNRWQAWESAHRTHREAHWENLEQKIRDRVQEKAAHVEDRLRDRMNRRHFNPGRMTVVAFFSSVNRRVEGPDFQGGELVAVLGSIEVDLTDAQMQLLPTYGAEGAPARRAVLDATAVFGSIDIKVPRNWRVVSQGSGVFGSYDNKTVPYRGEPGTEPPVLVIRGAGVFGTVMIQN